MAIATTGRSDYDVQGFIQPFRVFSPEAMLQARERVEQTVLVDRRGLSMRHLDCREIFDICCAPALLDLVESTIGPDLLVWRSRVFVKEPGDPGTPWHTDAAYFDKRLDPVVNVTAWVALADVDENNACLTLVPGSHREAVHHNSVEGAPSVFSLAIDPSTVSGTPLSLPMRCGECVVFNENLVHGSTPNMQARRRIGVAVRFTVPTSRILGKHLGAVLARGRDAARLNTLVVPR